MPSRARPGLLNKFLEELSNSLDLRKTIKKLGIDEDRARAMLRGLVSSEKTPAAHKDLFEEPVAPPAGEQHGRSSTGRKKAAPGASHAGGARAGKETHGAHHRSVYTINVDGACRGNPGPAGAGAVIIDPDGNVFKKLKKYLGVTTNNWAEYQALIMALEAASSLKLEKIRVLADSELMVKQINGAYRVKSPELKPLYEKARTLLDGFSSASVAHVYREKNSVADGLANEAIDGHRP